MTKVKLYKKLKDTQFDAKWVYFYIFEKTVHLAVLSYLALMNYLVLW